MTFQKCKCGYCVKKKFPLLWNIPKHPILWFEIPKNGSWIMKQHFKIDKQEKFIIREYDALKNEKPLVIIRDPIDRFRSLYGHYFTPEGLRYKLIPEDMKFFNPLDDTSITEILCKLKYLNTSHQCHHFHPQSWFVDEESFDEFQFVWLHELTDYLGVPKGNATSNVEKVVFNEQHKERIKRIYKDDYDFFERHKLI